MEAWRPRGQALVAGLFYDMRGIVAALHYHFAYMLFLDWLYVWLCGIGGAI